MLASGHADIFQLILEPIREISMTPIQYVRRMQSERVPLSLGQPYFPDGIVTNETLHTP